MKTLIATLIAAAALVGTQASADYDKVYTLSELEDGDNIIADTGREVLVNIDAQPTLDFFNTYQVKILTLNFKGSYVLKASYTFDTPDHGILNITSTVDAVKTDWEKAFSVEGGGSITLCLCSPVYIDDTFGTFQFFGTARQGTVKLGNTEVLFKGLVASKDALAMNQVGLVWSGNEIALVGKLEAPAPVPEPTTGSLSLLALAGLCARRRK